MRWGDDIRGRKVREEGRWGEYIEDGEVRKAWRGRKMSGEKCVGVMIGVYHEPSGGVMRLLIQREAAKETQP